MSDQVGPEKPPIRSDLQIRIPNTVRAPHLRADFDVPAVMRSVVLAVLPCVAMAIYNTGLQVNRALATGAALTTDWRGSLLGWLGVGHSPTSLWDCGVLGSLVFLPILGVSLAAGFLVEALFARMRRREPDHVALLLIALLFALCLPPTLPLWKAALGSGLGFLIGKEIFGGLGRNFLNPALTGLALLYFAYPGALSGSEIWVAVDAFSGATPLALVEDAGLAGIAAADLDLWTAVIGRVPGAMGATSPLACGLGAVFLLYSGVASWRILAGSVLGLVIGVFLISNIGLESPASELSWYWHAVTGSFAFGVVFLATDPVTSASTNPGRWVYGALIGFLVVLIRVANPAHREGVMLAILLGNVAAPLIDRVVARIQMRQRRDFDVG